MIRALIAYTPSKDMDVFFSPSNLPSASGGMGTMFDNSNDRECVKRDNGINNALNARKEVHFEAGKTYSILCDYYGGLLGVGRELALVFNTEEHIANLLSAGNYKTIAVVLNPYIARGDKFEPPKEKNLGAWVANEDVDYVYHWTAETGWVFTPLLKDGHDAEIFKHELVPLKNVDGSY